MYWRPQLNNYLFINYPRIVGDGPCPVGPRDGTSERFRARLEKRSGEHRDRRHTIVLARFHDRHQLPLAYLGADHTQVLSSPSRGDGWAHDKQGGSVAYLPQ